MKGGKVEILVNDQGNRITPSYVAWNDEERLVGDAGMSSIVIMSRSKQQNKANISRSQEPVCLQPAQDNLRHQASYWSQVQRQGCPA